MTAVLSARPQSQVSFKVTFDENHQLSPIRISRIDADAVRTLAFECKSEKETFRPWPTSILKRVTKIQFGIEIARNSGAERSTSGWS